MKNENWERIIADYKIAWNCFVAPKHCNGWYRQENKGLFYLLKAYLAAIEEPEKDHLWYARILQQMAYPGHFNLSEYERFHKYIEPSIKEYELVEKPEKYEKEIKFSRIEYENMKARIDYRNGESEECFKRYLSLVDNSELLEENDVWFHDGKVISFIHQGDIATLKFEYDNLIVTLEFGGISKIEMYYDEDNPYIFDFECYPCYQGDTNTKIFDIESHKITCETVRVASIEERPKE